MKSNDHFSSICIIIAVKNSLLETHLTYWGTVTIVRLSDTFICTIKALYNLDHLTPTKQMHKDLKLLMVEDIGKINTLKFVHNQRNNKTPIVFKNYFIENRAIHQHNTRQTKDLHNTHANSNKKQQLIKRRGTKLWNELPQSIRMPGGTLKTFTKHVKDRIISSYN